MDFGKKLYRLRIERGVYQKELAVYLNVSIGTISNYENNIHCPDLNALCKLAEYFHVSVDYLLGCTEYAASIDNLSQKLVNQSSVGNALNVITELSPESRRDLMKYLTMLKLYDQNRETDQRP